MLSFFDKGRRKKALAVAVAAFTVMAVSYTHLDVYKRQGIQSVWSDKTANAGNAGCDRCDDC